MREFWRFASRSAHLPFVKKAEETFHSFTASGRALFYFFAGLLVVSTLGLLYLLNQSLLITVPSYGGALTEGIIGSPRFINPTLAVTDADQDLTALIYSGLLRATPQGDYIPDLAQSYALLPDGTTYTVNLRKNATFHDGKPVTAEDVVFTISKVQDPAIKSPLRPNWDGVVAEEVDPYTVRFTLKRPYAPFIKNLTLGILPKHLWQDVSSEEFPFSELNTTPVGSGPFEVAGASHNSSGIPTSYVLKPFSNYALGSPYLSSLNLSFYQNEAALVGALKGGKVDAASGISPTMLKDLPNNLHIKRAPLDRVFGVFFNQNQSEVLRDKDVRTALTMATDRQKIISDVFGSFAVPLLGPIPPSLLSVGAATSTGTAPSSDAARQYLVSRGWQANSSGILQKTTGKGKNAKTLTLAFSLSTGNVPELRATAEELRSAWSAMGAQVEVKIFDQGDLSQNVIRPRKYDALLFGEVVGRELDLYPFWHSSERNDPGLNVALYANSTADTLLEEMRATSDPSQRQALYKKFNSELQNDIPAIFLYAPDFVYIVPNDLQGVELGFIESPSDRFLSVLNWHTQTEEVWPFFDTSH
jgi:peptide/nickel transport system substrate-binding protein